MPLYDRQIQQQTQWQDGAGFGSHSWLSHHLSATHAKEGPQETAAFGHSLGNGASRSEVSGILVTRRGSEERYASYVGVLTI